MCTHLYQQKLQGRGFLCLPCTWRLPYLWFRMGQMVHIRVVASESVLDFTMPSLYAAVSGIRWKFTGDHISRDVDTQSVVEFVRTPHFEPLVERPNMSNLLAKSCVMFLDKLEELLDFWFQDLDYSLGFFLVRCNFSIKKSLQLFVTIVRRPTCHRGNDFDLQQ